MGSPERRGFTESVVEYLWDTRSKEDLKLQLNEVVERQQPVEGAALFSFSPINLMLAVALLYIAYLMFRKWESSLCEAPGDMIADPDGEKNVNEETLQNDLQDKTRSSFCKALGEMFANLDGEEAVDGEAFLNDLQDKTQREEKISLHDSLGERVGDPDGEEDVCEEELQNDLQDKTGRKKKDDLCEALGETIVDTDVGDDNKLQNDMQMKKMFLEVYPQVKLELEQQIRKLRALADKIDKVHRDCTITQVVASSTGAVSGVLTILGLALAPVTAGVSLGLSATGLGLGAAAAVTSVSTAIVEKVSTVSSEAKAKDTGKAIKEILEESTPKLISISKNSFQNLKVIKKNIDAIKLAKANSHLANNAKRLMTTGRVSAQNARQVQKAFEGTALAMSKGARIMGAATAGLFLVLDVVSLVQDSVHLSEGAKTESAAKLRQQAQDLEQKLQELIRIHDSLTK